MSHIETTAAAILKAAVEKYAPNAGIISGNLQDIGALDEGAVVFLELEEEHACVGISLNPDNELAIECLYVSDGTSVSIKPVSEENVRSAIEWLVEHNDNPAFNGKGN